MWISGASLLIAAIVGFAVTRQFVAELKVIDEISRRGGQYELGCMWRVVALDLAACHVDDETLGKWLGAVDSSGLKELDLSGAGITNDALRDVGAVRGLEELTLSQCSGVNKSGLQHLAELTSLRILRLNLGGKVELLDRREGRKIESIPGVVEAGLFQLTNLTALEELDLSYSDVGTTPKWTSLLSPFVNLRKLYLKHTTVTDGDLKALVGKFPWLDTLELSSTRITDEGLKDVGQVRTLETLYLQDTNITEAGLNRLSNLSSLKVLDVMCIKDLQPGDEEALRQMLRSNGCPGVEIRIGF
jgi:Leucine-rich repeat (LRR) protein